MTGDSSITGAAIVTGAAHRLGRAMALSLARRGHDVAIHYDRSAEAAEAVAAEARAMGVRAVALQADLLDWGATEALIPAAEFVTSEMPSTSRPSARAAMASSAVDMPTRSAPTARAMRTSAGVS